MSWPRRDCFGPPECQRQPREQERERRGPFKKIRRLRLTARQSEGARGRGAEIAKGGLSSVWLGVLAAIGGKPLYGLPEARFERIRLEEGLISFLARPRFWDLRLSGRAPPALRADLHQRCIGPCSCCSSLQPVPHPVPHRVTSQRRVPHGVPLDLPRKAGAIGRKKAIPVRAARAETRSRRQTDKRRKDRIYGSWDERGASDLGSGRTSL